MEIACDESGYEGEKLIGTTTPYFAHGSVRLDPSAAAQCMTDLRERIRSPATEYKAGHVLRQKHRAVLEWLLDPAGPIAGRAHVFLLDKERFFLGKLIPDPEAAEAFRLNGPQEFGTRGWAAYLLTANDLMRARKTTSLDPLFPAIRHAVDYWSEPGATVDIVHDRQKTLTLQRIEQLRADCGGRLGAVSLVDSSIDPRVQVADVVAGAVRRIAEDDLRGKGNPRLVALSRPFRTAAAAE